jgi:hypothetical protein
MGTALMPQVDQQFRLLIEGCLIEVAKDSEGQSKYRSGELIYKLNDILAVEEAAKSTDRHSTSHRELQKQSARQRGPGHRDTADAIHVD